MTNNALRTELNVLNSKFSNQSDEDMNGTTLKRNLANEILFFLHSFKSCSKFFSKFAVISNKSILLK
jgi:hypothetical protein